jgi:hypothetical protein
MGHATTREGVIRKKPSRRKKPSGKKGVAHSP